MFTLFPSVPVALSAYAPAVVAFVGPP